MGSIKVDHLDEFGVVVDDDRAPLGSLSKAQNASANPLGERGAVRKRPGLKRFNGTAGAGTIKGGMGVPLPLGSAGLNIGNPFTDLATTITDYTAQVSPTTPKLGGTFDDRSFEYDFDWYFDFSEAEEFLGEDPIGAEALQFAAGDSNLGTSDGSVPVPVTFVGDITGTWSISLDTALAQDTGNNTTYTNTTPPLIFPTGAVRAYNAAGAGTGGVDNTAHPLYDFNHASATSKEDGYPVALLNGAIYYAGGTQDYTLDTDAPVLRAYDGYTDRIVARIPNNPDVGSGATVAKAIVSILAANDKLYIATFDGGATGAAGGTVEGSVFEFNPVNRVLIKLGATFPAGHLPYSLAWFYGRLWCGTGVNQINDNEPARIYMIRPGIDTAWTLDKTFLTNECWVTSLKVFQGRLYGSLLWNDTAAGTAKVVVRGTDATWGTSDSGTTATDGTGLARGYTSLEVFPQEGGSVTSPTPALFAIRQGISADADTGAVRKYDGSSWSTVDTYDFAGSGASNLETTYALSGTSIVPVLWVARGGGLLKNSTNGTSWTDRWAAATTEMGTDMGAATSGFFGMIIQR